MGDSNYPDGMTGENLDAQWEPVMSEEEDEPEEDEPVDMQAYAKKLVMGEGKWVKENTKK